MRKDELAKFLMILSDSLTAMTEEEYCGMLRGEGVLRYEASKRAAQRIKTGAAPADDRLLTLSLHLQDCDSRNAAISLLREDPAVSTKNALTKLALLLDVYVNKRDTKDAIIEKLVEATVGARLRSQAIRGTSLDRSTRD